MKRFGSKNKQGFTLIELLVVIAIIGILSTLLFPAIQGALLKTKATAAGAKMGSKGLTGVLYDISLDKNIANQKELFPQKGDYATSTDYIAAIFTNTTLTNVMQLSALTVPGQKNPPSTLDLWDDTANMWRIVEGITTSSDPGIPFMFTKNIGWTALDQDPTIELEADDGQQILADKLAVIVYAQGAVKVLSLNETLITKEVINGGGNYNNVVLQP